VLPDGWLAADFAGLPDLRRPSSRPSSSARVEGSPTSRAEQWASCNNVEVKVTEAPDAGKKPNKVASRT
jgi:hypothetical protein